MHYIKKKCTRGSVARWQILQQHALEFYDWVPSNPVGTDLLHYRGSGKERHIHNDKDATQLLAHKPAE